MHSLTFNDISFKPINKANQIWLTASQLAEALEYSDVRSVTNIYNRKKDEFTSGMTEVINLVTSEKSANLQTSTRIFSLRGCHLIAMFARTSVAKEFRQWVLDILDKEVGKPVQVKSTATDRTPLRQAVTALVAKYGLMHDEGYRLVHQYMGVNSIDEIPIDDLPEAVEYVHRLMLGTINDRELYDVLVSCAIHLKQFGTMLSRKQFLILQTRCFWVVTKNYPRKSRNITILKNLLILGRFFIDKGQMMGYDMS